MARRLRRACEAGHVPTHDSLVTMVHRWERAGLRGERYELLYARALGISPDELANGPAGPGVSSVPPVVGSEDGDDPVKRREFGMAALGALAGTLVPLDKASASVSMSHVAGLRHLAGEL
jgi:hypothetical protein